MTFHAKVQARFEALIDAGEKIKTTRQTVSEKIGNILRTKPRDVVDTDKAHEWTMNVLTIMKSALGESNDGYQQVRKNIEKCALYANFCIIQSCVKAALEDLIGGYFFEAKTLLEAEVFSDLLEQAEELQQTGYKDAAAVLAGGVLEKHLRSMCVRRSIGLAKPSGKHKMMNDMNDDLAKAGAYNALKKKQITAWADLRNNAAHGNTTAYTSSDVDAFLRDVFDFCANFS